MKKLLFSILAITMSVAAFSQVEKGSKLIGVGIGSIGYTNSESKTSYSNTPTIYNSDGNSFSLSVFPNVGWFISEKFALGGSVSISFYTSKSNSSNTGSSATSESKYNQPSFYIGPFARYYFGGSSKGMPFVQGSLSFGLSGGKSTSTSSSGSSSETKTNPKHDYSVGAYFGYEHFISSYVGFYASIGVSYGSSKYEYEYKPSSGTGYNYTNEYKRWNIPVNVGLQVHLPKKGKK